MVSSLPPFTLSHFDIDQVTKKGPKERVYIDEFKDVGDGRLYKG